MNVFRKKAKAKDDAYIIPPALASEQAPLSKMSRSLKRKQKNVPEPKLELDIATALPDTKDFRTSLLMPGLSARFSMLREQDDPSTLVGKASDDSVLFPKRASRLNLFTHNPLTDIAEVDSIHTTIRPPFAGAERSHSFSEGAGYTSDDSRNVIARTKATEGNNLFGGRQKMYKVPNASSSRDLTEGVAPLTSTRYVYQDDEPRSNYPEARVRGQEESEQQGSEERPISDATEEHERSSVVNTPSTGFSKSRGTISSTASGPSNRRTSTAATSVVSDSPIPRQSNLSSGSTARMRAPEFGGDENLSRSNASSDSRKPGHVSDHQDQPPLPISPISHRQVSPSRSATASNQSEKHVAGTPLRAASPPRADEKHVLASLDFGLKASKSQVRRYQTASPTNEYDDTDVYHQSLEPNDRGKATAMGLFNRPRQQFDEQKFEERQLRMHEGKIATSFNNHPGNGETSEQQPKMSTLATSVPSSPLKNSFPASNGIRSRAQSNVSNVNPAEVHAKVEALIKLQNEQYTALQASSTGPTRPIAPSPKTRVPTDQIAASRGTFLDTFDGSDDDASDVPTPILGLDEAAPRVVPSDVHPALRNGSQTFDFGDQLTASAQPTRRQSNASIDTSSASALHDTRDNSGSFQRFSNLQASDSPTLGPTTGLGLSGLIRTHLRHDSDKSSLLPPPSPAQAPKQLSRFPGFRERDHSVASTARTINPPESTHSDPWEFDNARRSQRSPLEPPSSDPTLVMSQKAQQILGQAISHRSQAATKGQHSLGYDPATGGEEELDHQWHGDVMHNHQRGESTETQKEFGNELAERARRIQEGLKGVVDAGKRSQSPMPGSDRPNPAAQALQVLRHRASKTALAPRVNESQPKAMKILGLGGMSKPDMARESPKMAPRSNFVLEQAQEGYGSGPDSSEQRGEFEHSGGRQTPGFGRPVLPGNHQQAGPERPRQRSATPTSGRTQRRERGEPEPGARSRSRAAHAREEHPFAGSDRGRPGPPPGWEQQRSHGVSHGQPGQRGARGPHMVPRGPPPVDPRNYERSASVMSNRRPSASRPEPAGYFKSRAATPTLAGTPQLGNGHMHPTINPPRPSPRPPFPHSPMSPFGQPGQSPGLSAPPSAVQSALPSPVGPLPPPPNHGRSTPVEGRSTPAGARKKSVTKGMISEPTFISSTSSVPLIGLPKGPRPSQIATPPIPAMNPRRRGDTLSERTEAQPSPLSAQSLVSSKLETRAGLGLDVAPGQRAWADQQQQKPVPRQRNRLRKISSEGGGMAARARQQAMMTEFSQERLRSPALPVFPNRSATSLSMHQDGGMI